VKNVALCARWSDERGANTVAGVVRSTRPLRLLSPGSGLVTIPDHAAVYQPARPTMRYLGTARAYCSKEETEREWNG